ncbi:hypothetical protein CU633_14070 [Bacillus sp. V3-13]|uniref:hypothetical protein n=1 Tax=Bacillus sp. V3-13 TaxID=2053728 RepID=UPI000C79331E|nr:hypothetical protein [Bacillus sp. V3-13]PLR76758.1 hypothetical protein CU633_14070 [Bacillus sp. V3-13]
MVILSVNELVVDIESNKAYRILWIDPGYVITYVIDIDIRLKKALPFIMTTSFIEEKVCSGEFAIRMDIGVILRRKPTENDISHRDKTWGFIKEIVNIKPDIFMKERRNKLIDQIMIKHNIGSKNTVLKNLRKYWQRGMDKDCLFPDYCKHSLYFLRKVGVFFIFFRQSNFIHLI